MGVFGVIGVIMLTASITSIIMKEKNKKK